MSATRSRHAGAVPYVVLCITFWSLIPALADQVSDDRLDPYQFLFFSNLVSSAVLLVVTCVRGQVERFAAYTVREVAALASLGALGSFGYYALLYSAYSAGDDKPGLLVAVQYTWPALTVVVSSVLLRERASRRAVVAILLALMAVVVTCWRPGQAVPAGAVAMTGIAALTFAVYSAWSKLRHDEPYTSLTIVFVSGALLSWPLWIAIGQPLRHVTGKELALVVLNGAVVNGVSYVWWLEALKRAPTAFLAPWLSTIPVFGLAVLAFRGHGGVMLDWLGVTLILLSIYLASSTSSEPVTPTSAVV